MLNKHGLNRAFRLSVIGVMTASGLFAFPAQAFLDEDDFSTPDEARLMQERVIDLIDRTRPAVVGVEILVQDDRGRMLGVAGGSGTIIDAEDGIILTAGHVGRAAGLPVRVYLDDGSMLEAETLGQHLDGQEDCGLIKIDPAELERLPEGVLQALPMGDSSKVEVDDWVIVFGHVLGIEKTPWRPPPVRIGRITGNHGHVITMDASLNSGDSGGPLIDLEGRLIGINESCAGHPFENAATAVGVAMDRMESMLRAESTGSSLPDPDEGYALDPRLPTTHPIIFDPADEFSGRNDDQVLVAFEDATWDASDWVVRIYRKGEQIALGLVVDAGGFAVTKASEVDPRQERILVGTPVGLQEEAVPVGIDPKLDLLLLKLPPGEWVPAPLDEIPLPEAGSWLVSAGPDASPISIGICSLDDYESDLSILDRAFLGVRADRAPRGSSGAMVRQIVPGCAARRAGLRNGDIILAIDGAEVRGSRGLIEVLSNHRANDIVNIEYRRDGEDKDVLVRLGARLVNPQPNLPMIMEHESGNIVIPVSRRDTGFGRVIQHDGLIRPEQCGGPLVDLDGRLVGINIARSDRTKTFAIPVEDLVRSIQGMKGQPGITKTMLAIDPRTLQVPIEDDEEGSFVLVAADAQLFGPAIRYSQHRDQGYIGNWLSHRDEILWVIDDPEPGAYGVYVDQASANRGAGGRYEMSSNRDSIEVVVQGTEGPYEFESIRVGEIEIDNGDRVVISLQSIGDPALSLMHLRSIKLVPVID